MVEQARLNLSFGGNWTRSRKFQATPTSLNRDCVGYYSVNCGSIQPKYSFTQRTTLSAGQVDLSLLWRYTHKLRSSSRHSSLLTSRRPKRPTVDADGVLLPIAQQGCPNFATDAGDAIVNGGGGCLIDSRFRQIKAYNYFDLTTRFNVTDNFEFTVTVDEPVRQEASGRRWHCRFDDVQRWQHLPVDATTRLGRRFAVGARVKF